MAPETRGSDIRGWYPAAALAEKPPLFPPLFTAISRAAIAAVLLINLYNALGFAGFSYGGSSFSFGRQHDRQLYAIDDKRAFLVTGSDKYKSIAVVKYEDGPLLFRLCGRCQTHGGVFPWPKYKKGNWVYTDMPYLKGPAAYNLKTGELVTLQVEDPKGQKLDPDDIPFYAEHGFTFDDERKIDVALLDQEFKYVSTQNEMCIILQIVAFLVLGILGVIALILLPAGLRRRRLAS